MYNSMTWFFLLFGCRVFAACVINCRPAFGGRDCEGEGTEAELCNREVRFHWSCLQ